MAETTTKPASVIRLPSDQDSTGRSFGSEEKALVLNALDSGTLTSTKGEYVKTLEAEFAASIGISHAHACSSGTAAIHIAIAAIDPNPGDEIVTTAITDMGALTPIVYQGAIPVFADVDPETCNVTASTIEPCLSERTRVIIVTHLFGNPCEMGPILELAAARNIPVIEDCAQAFRATYDGRDVGTMGTIGCFSLQQGKHITCGEGGMVVTDDEKLARRMFLLINKAWGYGDAKPDHYFIALNYRMSELQGAVALAQLRKLPELARTRIELAAELSSELRGLDGIRLPVAPSKAVHSYWKYCPMIDRNVVPGGSVALGALLKARGVASAPRYIQKPAFMCEVFAKQRTFGDSRFPFTLARPEAVDYSKERFPGTFKALEDILVLPWNERYEREHVAAVAEAIKESLEEAKKGDIR